MNRVKIKALLYWCRSFVVHKRKSVIVSLINALILTLVTYFMNNSPLWTGENLGLYASLDYIKGGLLGREYVNDSILLINVAYDKQLAKKKIDSINVGNTDVTDRKAIVELLSNLKAMDKDNSYRYIFLDLIFRCDEETDCDSLLFEEISNTPRLVIADDKDVTLASNKLKNKAAYSDYKVTLSSTNFVRYLYLRSKGESMPLRAYRELCHDSINRHGWFYTCNHGLCQNTLAIRSYLDTIGTTRFSEDGLTQVITPSYYNLNKINNKSTIAELAKNKYVIVGNLIDDSHDTFYGATPGAVIVFSAFWALKNGEHHVKLWIEILLFIIFFCISLSLFSPIPVIDRVSWIRKSKSKFLRFIVSFLGYSTVLLITTSVLYLCFGVISSIWVPALYFSIQKTCLTYKNMTI